MNENELRAATTLQRTASDPSAFVWVSASAGSGKTTVLTARLLRLMLPDGERSGAHPSRILCLTFTRVAAGEMKVRLMRRLQHWAVCSADNLARDLSELLGTAPDAAQTDAARALFARVLDVPGGMNIMTIHAFCMSVLRRFPLEAGLPPAFELVEGPAFNALLDAARLSVLSDETRLSTDVRDLLLREKGVDTLRKLSESFVARRFDFLAAAARAGGADALIDGLHAALDLSDNKTGDEILSDFSAHLTPARRADWVARLSAMGGKTGPSAAAAMQVADNAATVFDIFLTKTGGVRAAFLKDNVAQELQDIASFVLDVRTSVQRADFLHITRGVLRFGAAVIAAFSGALGAQSAVDNTGLIAHTAALLRDSGAAWVQYRLDGGIDHVLVDEAQDTSPLQWEVITRLTDSFTEDTANAGERPRSLFVVGDDKQSIFSFQDAAPHLFRSLRARTEERCHAAALPFRSVPMQTSFRSVPLILSLVDHVFAQSGASVGVADDGPVTHRAARADEGGEVTIWPLFTVPKQKKDKDTGADWDRRFAVTDSIDPVVRLTDALADHIHKLLSEKHTLPARHVPLQAGGILVVVRQRGRLVPRLIRALKRRGIAVEGLDRMTLKNALPVQDVLGAIAFATQPLDDLSLAGVLRSPFVGLTDADLFGIANARRGSLFDALCAIPAYAPVAAWLNALIDRARLPDAHGFVTALLDTPTPARGDSGLSALIARLGPDAEDPLMELLSTAQDFTARNPSAGLQDFRLYIEQSGQEIKRQQDEQRGAVRIMTVHGAKGLQAPLVILPDTVRKKNRSDSNAYTKIYWPQETGLATPIPYVPKDMMGASVTAAMQRYEAAQDAEYNRLLYVALTRAEDALLICGAMEGGDDDRAENDWYASVMAGVSSMGDAVHAQPFTLAPDLTGEDAAAYTIRTTGLGAPPKHRATDAQNNAAITPSLPAWLHANAPTPVFPPRPLTPSKSLPAPPALSPLAGDPKRHFKRGVIIHTLLQYLPTIAASEQDARASAYLSQPAHELTPSEQAEIADTVFKTLRDPRLAPLFGPSSRAEIPLTGMVTQDDGTPAIVSGQVDRLLVDDTRVLVLDYKTNRPAPASAPDSYRRQIGLYRRLLAQIYPDRQISCYLLWTDGPRLMEI